MAKLKDDTRTQRQKFIDAGKAHGADTKAAADAFRKFVSGIATAPVAKPKKAAKKRKGA